MQKTTIGLVFGLVGLAAGSLLSNASSAASPNYGEDRAQIEDLQARYLFALDFLTRANTIGGFGHYEDDMVKVNGQWFFTKRKIFNEGSARWQYKGDRNPAW